MTSSPKLFGTGRARVERPRAVQDAAEATRAAMEHARTAAIELSTDVVLAEIELFAVTGGRRARRRD